MNNPFSITKAVDYSNDDIIRYWVDISPTGSGFWELLRPTSLMPIILLGSKGSGKTHLMRYFSYDLQKIRHSNNIKDGLEKDNFIGIYLRGSSLNSDRFNGKGQSEEVWNVVYSYYWELWIGQLLLNILDDLFNQQFISLDEEKVVISEIVKLFEKKVTLKSNTIKELVDYLNLLQKSIDYEVNNCIFKKDSKLTIEVLLSPSKFTFGIPKILGNVIPLFKRKVFLYLIDEFENIIEYQQKLIQTLLREKEQICSFRIGARLYGIKTYKTLGSGEENKEGSEYEKIVLDDFFRKNEGYNSFVRNICVNRLTEAGIIIPQNKKIDNYFEDLELNKFFQKINQKKERHSKAYLERLANKIKTYLPKYNDVVEIIISNLTFSEDPIIERTNVMLLYRDWKAKKNLLEASKNIREIALDYFNQPANNKVHGKILEKYKSDIIDQLARETREQVPYFGFEKFIKMSCGIPRNLLNILKYTYKWSYFNDGKIPFKEGIISHDSQSKGVIDAAEWFFEDNRIPIIEGNKATNCIHNLGQYLREHRFSDNPPECSINLFSIKIEEININAREIVDYLVKYSYLIERDKRRDKNSNNLLCTYHINWILAPKWELPIAQRGVMTLNKKEAETIFDPNANESFTLLLKEKVLSYNAPFASQDFSLTLFANDSH